jgi:hypothetical protein
MIKVLMTKERMSLMLKNKFFDLQFFAEEDPPVDPPVEPNPPADPPTDPPKTYDEEYVKKLRQEAAGYRTKAKEFETALTGKDAEYKNKDAEFRANLLKTLGIEADPNKDLEKQLQEAQGKNQALQSKADTRLIKAEIKLLASELGIVDPDAAYSLMDKGGIKVNEDDSIEGVKESLAKLLEAKPYLKAVKVPPNVGGGGSNPGGGGSTAPTKEELEAMPMDQYIKFRNGK